MCPYEISYFTKEIVPSDADCRLTQPTKHIKNCWSHKSGTRGCRLFRRAVQGCLSCRKFRLKDEVVCRVCNRFRYQGPVREGNSYDLQTAGQNGRSRLGTSQDDRCSGCSLAGRIASIPISWIVYSMRYRAASLCRGRKQPESQSNGGDVGCLEIDLVQVMPRW